MTFQVNGGNGRFDGKIKDKSLLYGTNAVDNHVQHLQAPLANENFAMPPILDFSGTSEAEAFNEKLLEKYTKENDAYLNSLPPLEYEYRYMPNLGVGKVDKKAVLAAAYQEMGQVKEMPVKEFEDKFLVDQSQTAEPLDINKDGKIDIAEYGANIIATDLLSKGVTDPMKADGVINAKGMNAILAYTKKSNADAAAKLYSNVYTTHNLGSQLNEFTL